MKINEAITQLRKEKKRKFSQTLDIIVSLKGIDLRRDSINAVINIPNKIKDKKVCGFLNSKSNIIDVVTKPEFAKFKDKKEMKKLVDSYDFFIASAPLMPLVATTFGKVLGPTGKMPTPQLGLVTQETDTEIKGLLERVSKAIKIRAKEPCIKVGIGNENMPDKEIIENFNSIYDGIVNALPKKKENIKKIMVKLTMTKPIKVEAE